MNKAFVPITGLFFALIIITTPTRLLGGFLVIMIKPALIYSFIFEKTIKLVDIGKIIVYSVRVWGRLAQLVEQLTLNQRAQSSSL